MHKISCCRWSFLIYLDDAPLGRRGKLVKKKKKTPTTTGFQGNNNNKSGCGEKWEALKWRNHFNCQRGAKTLQHRLEKQKIAWKKGGGVGLGGQKNNNSEMCIAAESATQLSCSSCLLHVVLYTKKIVVLFPGHVRFRFVSLVCACPSDSPQSVKTTATTTKKTCTL